MEGHPDQKGGKAGKLRAARGLDPVWLEDQPPRLSRCWAADYGLYTTAPVIKVRYELAT